MTEIVGRSSSSSFTRQGARTLILILLLSVSAHTTTSSPIPSAAASSTVRSRQIHEAYLRNQRDDAVRISLYHGGYGSGFHYDKNVTHFENYLSNIVDFVERRHVDRVYLSISDPVAAANMLKHKDVVVDAFMTKLPAWVDLGALVAINPKYPWTPPSTYAAADVVGGLGPYDANPCSDVPILSREDDAALRRRRDITPPPPCSRPSTLVDAAVFCGSKYTVLDSWTADRCDDLNGTIDPCAFVDASSYCKDCGLCHGMSTPVTASSPSDGCGTGPTPAPSPPSPSPPSPPATSCMCPSIADLDDDATLSKYPWCPYNLELAVDLLAEFNRMALSTTATARIFTNIAWDKEGAGVYGEAGAYLKAHRLMVERVVPTIPDDYATSLGSVAELGGDKSRLIRVGDAGEGSKNPDDDLKAVDCEALDSKALLPKNVSVATCRSDVEAMRDALEAFPEQYWYADNLKENGCVGCPHGGAQLFATSKRARQVSAVDQCDACASVDQSCKPYTTYFTPGLVANFTTHANETVVMSPYDACVNGYRPADDDAEDEASGGDDNECPLACCECLGCLPCAFDARGAQPNDAVVYQKYRNDPKAMAAYFRDVWERSQTLELLRRRPNNTWTMFSIETAHDWTFSNYEVAGAGGSNFTNATCLARRFGGDTCGTFDGFGTWDYLKFEEMLVELYRETGVSRYAIYEIQFLPEHW